MDLHIFSVSEYEKMVSGLISLSLVADSVVK
jgi:hypothetical protein